MISGPVACFIAFLTLVTGFICGVAYMIWDRSRENGNEPRWQTIGRNCAPGNPMEPVPIIKNMVYVPPYLVGKDLNKKIHIAIEDGERTEAFVVVTDDFGSKVCKQILMANVP